MAKPKQYVLTLDEMERRFGPSPRADEPCSLCGTAGGEHHADDCPWMVWANSPRPERV